MVHFAAANFELIRRAPGQKLRYYGNNARAAQMHNLEVLMYARLSCFLLAVLLAPTIALAAPVELTSAITDVTVFADRARVHREGALDLAEGLQEAAFSKLPGWIDEESIRIAVSPAGAARILDVRIERSYLAKTDDKDIRQAEEAVQEIADELTALEDEIKILDTQRAQIEAVRAFATEQLPKDTLTKGVDAVGFDKIVTYVSDTLRETAKARREVDQQKRALDPERKVRQKRLDELRQRNQLEQRRVVVTLEGAKAAAATLGLTYLLPGATWEPVHELRADDNNPSSVSLASYAVVSQTSGEDWDHIQIAFSTQSPSEILRIPELQTLMLGTRPAANRRTKSKVSSFGKAQEIFAGQNSLFNKWNNPNDDQQFFYGNQLRMNEIQTRISSTFEQLQERGTTALFDGAGRPTVRSDGRLVRVPIGTTELAAKPRIVAVPEASLNAVHTVELANTGDHPLLPGTVALYREGAFLGNTDMDFVAEGESFSLLLGVADQIKLSRVLDKKQSALVRGQRTRMDIAFILQVENLSDEVVSLVLSDRIPVSQDKEIKVSRISIQPKVEADSQGMIEWKIMLAPGELREHVIKYNLEYPQHAVARQRMEQMNNDAMPAAAEDLFMQIDDLESNF